MQMIRPFRGLRPAPDKAAQVVAPPYDVLNTEEARAKAEGRPWSFLHISRAEIDLPMGTDTYANEVYTRAKENFEGILKAEILRRDQTPCYYLYQLQMDDHRQTGLVAVASVAQYNKNEIRKHEYTRPDKEDDRVRQIDILNAQTGPVFLTYKHNKAIDQMVAQMTQSRPDVDVTADDGVQHCLWVVSAAEQVKQIDDHFSKVENLYIADGHHRSAAASRVAADRHHTNQTNPNEQSSDFFLSVIFPDNQVKILDYNRLVKDLNELQPEDFLAKVSNKFTVKKSAQAVKPDRQGQYGMYLTGQWYQLIIKPELIPQNDPVRRLDISLLADHLITPILGIDDPRRDKRIDFVGGIRGMKELERRVDSGEMVVAFSLYPTSLSDLMAVADAGEVMPPKSTWFEPKLADGLITHVLD